MKTYKYFFCLAALGTVCLVFGCGAPSNTSGSSSEPSLPKLEEKTQIEVVEDCPFGRCPCMTHRIKQTSVPAGWSKLKKEKFSVHRCTPAPKGYRAEPYLRKNLEKCVICPEGMEYSANLRDSRKIRARANLKEDQCVRIQRTCLDDKRPK